MTETPQTDKSDSPIMHDGTLVFRVERGGEEPERYTLDLLMLKLTCEAMEAKHSLRVAEGRLIATPAFLLDLAGELQTLGVENCTPTIAWQVWISASQQLEALKKNIEGTPN